MRFALSLARPRALAYRSDNRQFTLAGRPFGILGAGKRKLKSRRNWALEIRLLLLPVLIKEEEAQTARDTIKSASDLKNLARQVIREQ